MPRPSPLMSRPRPLEELSTDMIRPCPPVARFSLVVGACLVAAAMTLPGCWSQSEGRPAGTIEVKNSRTSSPTAAIEAAKAKAKPSPLGR